MISWAKLFLKQIHPLSSQAPRQSSFVTHDQLAFKCQFKDDHLNTNLKPRQVKVRLSTTNAIMPSRAAENWTIRESPTGKQFKCMKYCRQLSAAVPFVFRSLLFFYLLTANWIPTAFLGALAPFPVLMSLNFPIFGQWHSPPLFPFLAESSSWFLIVRGSCGWKGSNSALMAFGPSHHHMPRNHKRLGLFQKQTL